MMRCMTSDGIEIHVLPECAVCAAVGARIDDMDVCPCDVGNDFGITCIPDVCEHYDEPRNYNFWERNVPICPLHSDNEVTEFCMQGPCAELLNGLCPIDERKEE